MRRSSIFKVLPLFLLAMLAGLFFPPAGVFAQSPSDTPPTANQLIAAINNIRTGNGLPPLEVDSILMGTAFSTAQHMAATGSCAHTGGVSGRVAAAGYGGSSAFATENISCGKKTLDQIINVAWADELHMLPMKDGNYRSIGAGVAEVNGYDYFVMHAAYPASGRYTSGGSGNNQPGNPQSPLLDPTQVVIPVQTAVPQADGSIYHKVLQGQSPWAIAVAYGIHIQDLVALNPDKLSENDLTLYPGEILLVRMAFTPTISPTITETPIPPTRTPKPTYTPRPTRTRAPTQTPTDKPLLPEIPSIKMGAGSPVGFILIVVCGIGLLLVIFGSFRKHSS